MALPKRPLRTTSTFFLLVTFLEGVTGDMEESVSLRLMRVVLLLAGDSSLVVTKLSFAMGSEAVCLLKGRGAVADSGASKFS